MFKIFLLLLTTTACAGNLQNSDFATSASITGAGGSVSQLLNTSKIYDSTNAQLLDTTIAAKQPSLSTSGAVANQFVTGFTAPNTFTRAQPAFTDISGTAAVTQGGTGITSGTSGGVPYFSAGTTIASSALLAANELILGGGAGVAPSTLGSLGTTTTVLHGNAGGAPTFGPVALASDVSGTLPIANGGTGQTTANAALNALLPTQTGNSGKFLQTDGTNTSWQTASGGSSTDYVFYGTFSASTNISTTSGTYALATTSTGVSLNSVLNENMGTVVIYAPSGNHLGVTFTPPALGVYEVTFTSFQQPLTAGVIGQAALTTSLGGTYLDEQFFQATSAAEAGTLKLSGVFKVTSLTSIDVYPLFKRFNSGTVQLSGSGLTSFQDNKITIKKIN